MTVTLPHSDLNHITNVMRSRNTNVSNVREKKTTATLPMAALDGRWSGALVFWRRASPVLFLGTVRLARISRTAAAIASSLFWTSAADMAATGSLFTQRHVWMWVFALPGCCGAGVGWLSAVGSPLGLLLVRLVYTDLRLASRLVVEFVRGVGAGVPSNVPGSVPWVFVAVVSVLEPGPVCAERPPPTVNSTVRKLSLSSLLDSSGRGVSVTKGMTLMVGESMAVEDGGSAPISAPTSTWHRRHSFPHLAHHRIPRVRGWLGLCFFPHKRL